MSHAHANRSALILVASGVDAMQLTEMQRALTKAGVNFSTVAPESSGLVHSWHEGAWGHHLPADKQISEVLGSDYDFLILPGGSRGVDKLKQNLHTRRIVNHFLDAQKPISAIAEGVALLALGTRCAGRSVAALESLTADLTTAQVQIIAEAMHHDDNIMTCHGPEAQPWIEAFFATINDIAADNEASEQQQAA